MTDLLETIRTTTVDLRASVQDTEVVVAVDRETCSRADLPPVSKRLTIPEERRTEELLEDLWADELTYPECTEADQGFEDLVGADALIDAIREVGDTAIAHLVGADDYLSAARAVLVSRRDTDFTIQTFALTANSATGLLVPDTSRVMSGLILQSFPAEDRRIGIDKFTWPSTQSSHLSPDLSGEPALALSLRLMGGGE